jgi:DNA-binding MarR family transcriptional regulator
MMERMNGGPVVEDLAAEQVEDGVRWLTADQLRDWTSLVAMVMLLPSALDGQLKRDAGLNSFEYHVLASLSEAPGWSVPMSDLAVVAQGSASRLSHAVGRLERDGWVERRSCREAGRRTAAHLTPAGMRKLEDAALGHVREARRLVVDALTADQLRALGAAARAIVAIVEPGLTERLSTAAGRDGGRREQALAAD